MRNFAIGIVFFSVAAWLLPAVPADDNKDPKKQLPPKIAKLIAGSPENFIRTFDRNKRGYLTKDELPPRLAAAFDKFDANSDNKLDKKEVQEMLYVLRRQFGITGSDASKAKNAPTPAKTADAKEVERTIDSMLQRMDSNKDGKISRDEAKGPLANNFDRLDTNKDGYLDRSELRPAAERFLAAQENAKANGQAKPQPDFDALDANADGRLSREELKGTPFADAFDEIDTNKDGTIDRKEFQAYLRKQRDKQDPKP